jgi:plasmid stabilization system protein ParE
MPQITYSEQTSLDFARIAIFLDSIAPNLKERAISEIIKGVDVLRTFPEITAFCPDEPYKHMRELKIPFGKSAYLVLYEYDKSLDEVIIATIRHAKESGYKI